MNVVFTSEARNDLDRIAAAIAEESPKRAVIFINELRQYCEGLADMPNRFQLVPRYEHTGVRRRVVGNYLVFYRVGARDVEILHILYGARDYAPILFPES
jgi:plasmid stabilization system protein ParE